MVKFRIKTIWICVAALLVVMTALVGCAENFVFPSTAEEEYARVYGMNDGKVFDYTKVNTYTVSQTLSVDIQSLREMKDGAGNRVYPASQQRTYLYDARDKAGVKSTVTRKLLGYATPFKTTKPTYRYERETYYFGSLGYPIMNSAGNQTDTAVEKVATFSSYGEYLSDARSFDKAMQTRIKYPLEIFSSFTGGTSNDGKTYDMVGIVSSEKYAEFFEIFAAEYSFVDWYTELDGGDAKLRMYTYFLSPASFESVTVKLSSDKNGLIGTSVSITAVAVQDPLSDLELGEKVIVTADTKYSAAEFAAGAVEAPRFSA